MKVLYSFDPKNILEKKTLPKLNININSVLEITIQISPEKKYEFLLGSKLIYLGIETPSPIIVSGNKNETVLLKIEYSLKPYSSKC